MANNQNTQYGSAGPQSSSGGSPPPVGSLAQSSNNETIVAGFAHLSSFFAPLICPLIIWLVTRDSMPYASRQGKQAFFFHLLVSAVGLVVSLVLFFIVLSTFLTASQAITSQTAPASSGFPVWFPALLTFGIILGLSGQALSVYGAVQAFQGKDFSYPLLGWL